MEQCPKCGTIINDTDIFCCRCGRRLIQSQRGTKTRGNGQGTAYKLPNGTWACEITKYVGGDRKRCRKKGFKTKKDAVAYISQFSLNKKRKETMTICEAYKAIAPSLSKLSEKRQKTYERAYTWLDYISLCDINELDINDLQGVIDNVEGGFYSKRYVKDLLNKIYSYAYADGKIDRNIVPYIVLPENNSTEEKTIFTKDEIKILWKKWNDGEEIAGLLLICLYCCIRTGELWTIRCNSVDFDSHVMYGGIKTTKGKYAPIFICDAIEPIIRHFVEKGEEHFYNKSPISFYRAWSKFKKDNNIRDNVSPYCGRHSCTSALTEAELPEAVIMQITRHTKYDTTLMYTHIDTDSIVQKMNIALNEQLKKS